MSTLTPTPAVKASLATTRKTDITMIKSEPIHDLQYQVRLVREALRSEKRRLGFFLGAGCPLGIYDKDELKSIEHIPDVAGLTSAIEDNLSGEKNFLECWKKLMGACKSDKCKVPNVEHIPAIERVSPRSLMIRYRDRESGETTKKTASPQETQTAETMSVLPTSSAEPSIASLSLAVTVDPAINYAFQQNAIPVVKELRFQNDGVARKDLVIRVTTEPAFAEGASQRASTYKEFLSVRQIYGNN